MTNLDKAKELLFKKMECSHGINKDWCTSVNFDMHGISFVVGGRVLSIAQNDLIKLKLLVDYWFKEEE